MKHTLTFVLAFFCFKLFSQNPSLQAVSYYDQGVNYFKQGRYRIADSLFTLSNALEPHRDTYYSRAVCRQKMGNQQGFCEDLAHATQLGDKESHRLFWTQCGTTDTVFLDYKGMPCKREDYASADVTYKSSFFKSDKTVRYLKEELFPSRNYSDSKTAHQETMPEPPGGIAAYYKYIASNYKKPATFSGTGRIFVKFVVRSDGQLDELQILRGLPGCPECDAEALRVLRGSSAWKPGMQDGKPANVYYTLPITVR